MILDKPFFKSLKKDFDQSDKLAHEARLLSDKALHDAKRAIFSLHRDDWKEAQKLLEHALINIKQAGDLLEAKPGSNALGSFRAALEEFMEAELFRQFLYKEKLGEPKGLTADFESYLGGLTDVVGEVLRYAVKQATKRQFVEVRRSQEFVDSVMAELMEYDFTGYLRTKFDQAKQARRKLEEVAYEVSLRGRK